MLSPTSSLRVAKQNENALALAEYLEGHPKVKRVHYPGLESHPQHTVAKKQMRGYGGLLAFELDGGLDEVTSMFDHLRLVKLATSLGGVDTIATIPTILTHGSLSPEEKARMGITESLVRCSVGIEDFIDLRSDFEGALFYA
jgi:cystathionine gamma-lyase